MIKCEEISMKKAEAQYLHTKKRALERFGINLGLHQYQYLIHMIRTGKAKFIKRRSIRVSMWEVVLPDGSIAIAPYDKQRRRIITLMTAKMEEE